MLSRCGCDRSRSLLGGSSEKGCANFGVIYEGYAICDADYYGIWVRTQKGEGGG
jgi:hypothetical protein